LEQLGFLGVLDQLDFKVQLEIRAILDSPDLKVFKDFQEQVDGRVNLVQLEIPDHRAPLERLETRVALDYREVWDLPALVVQLDQRDQQEWMLLPHEELTELKEQQEIQACQEHRDLQVWQEIQVRLDY